MSSVTSAKWLYTYFYNFFDISLMIEFIFKAKNRIILLIYGFWTIGFTNQDILSPWTLWWAFYYFLTLYMDKAFN